MSKFLRHLRGGLDRSINSIRGRKASIAYAFGTWTLLGVFFFKWKLNHFDLSQASAVPQLTEEEKEKQRVQQRLEQKKRSEEICIHVAENIYTPLDFMS